MAAGALLIVAGASAAGGSAALRFAWSHARRSIGWNSAGWGLFALAVVTGWAAAGAWGVAMATLWGMGAAMALLAYAAATAPAASGAKASNRRANMLPQGNEKLHLLRRIITFLLVALVAMIVSIGLALATRGLLLAAGASEANAIVLAFFAMPLAWMGLSYALLMQERRARQWRLLLLWAVPGLIALGAGLAA